MYYAKLCDVIISRVELYKSISKPGFPNFLQLLKDFKIAHFSIYKLLFNGLLLLLKHRHQSQKNIH